MEIVILDYRQGEVIYLTIPSNIEDIESYLIKNHSFHNDCHYMVSDSLTIIDNRS